MCIIYDAFENCSNFKEIYFEKTNEEIEIVSFDSAVFAQCKNLSEVDFENIKLLAITSNMFNGCEKLKKVRLS